VFELLLVDALVGWLVAELGGAGARRLGVSVLGAADERALRSLAMSTVTDVIAQLPPDTRHDLSAALRERGDPPPLAEMTGTGPRELLAAAVREWLAPLTLPSQTLAIHRVDLDWLNGAILDALLDAVSRSATLGGPLANLSMHIELERIRTGLAQLSSDRSTAESPTVSLAVVNTLPAVPSDFTGRDAALGDLLAAVSRGGDRGAPIHAIHGMAGVGKSALALCAAHLISPRYPDGQLHLDLHGFTPGRSPVSAHAALESLLLAIGVLPNAMPADGDRRAALWRSKIAGRRVLLLLDNAVDATQVVPLIPGTSSGLVLITSRRSLIDIDGVNLLRLGAMEDAEAMELFCKASNWRISSEAEGNELTRIVDLCGRLPLAIRIAAARLRQRPSLGLTGLISDLSAAYRRLDVLEDDHRGILAAFESSYLALDDDARRLFRRLGLHPGPDITVAAAAALAGVDAVDAEALMVVLLANHLVVEEPPRRFLLHDLLREYARHLVRSESKQLQNAAENRLIDHYIMLARIGESAAAGSAPSEKLKDLGANGPAASGSGGAFEREQANLIGCISIAARRAHPRAPELVRLVGRLVQQGGAGGAGGAEAFYEAAWQISSQVGDEDGAAFALYQLAETARVTHGWAAAGQYYQTFYDFCLERDLHDLKALALECLAGLVPGPF
jgi:hypothetical protein